ncbi:YHS domain-containing protein [Rubinisphaera sp.]|uniref:YHS domain-containing protein n=1 Tax=Rubinisphaera sp. TaxID=2024857 RepID=UPI0025F22252|nr:YHS domain-containing protein [Rubinisphaera sp.]|tara:strand:+ start:935 stop:1369 length:435 start_codon:yes stop_codon:yes gene_type:complete
MKNLLTTLGICLLSLMTLTISAAEEKKAEPQCPVSGKAISKDHSVSYKGAEVYFCCPKCPKAFEMDTKKYAAKANHQLVQTDQAKQVKCPITGRPDREDKAVTVNGVEVNFCCGNCLKAANEADDKVVMLFNDKAFEKGFKVTE